MKRNIVFDFYNVLYDPEVKEVRSAVLDCLEKLHNDGVSLFLFTNSRECFLKHVDSKFGFLKYFNGVVSCYKDRKPSDWSFKRLKEVVDDDYENMVLIDDSEKNLSVAKDLGISTVRFQTVNDLSLINGV